MTDIRVIRYRTRPECADENARLIAGVFAELSDRNATGLRYLALRLGDDVSFLHVAQFDGSVDLLADSPAFAAFQAGIADRVDQGPLPAAASVVGAHRMPGWEA